jgi:type IV pilus assembly protein PilY1
MINKFKIIFISFLISLLNITGVGIAKPLPPGSGAGDIPANILILLDTSESMNSNPFGGDMLSKVGDVILLDDGDILVGQMDSAGVVKMNYASEELDRTFNNNKGSVRGNSQYSCKLMGGSLQPFGFSTVTGMAKSSNVKGHTGEAIYVLGPEAKVIGMDTDGNCLEVIWGSDLGRTHTKKKDKLVPKALTIGTIGTNDHLLITSMEIWCSNYKNRKRCRSNKFFRFDLKLYSKNLTTGDVQLFSLDSKYREALQHATSMTIDSNGEYLYSSANGFIYRTKLKKEGNNYSLEGAVYKFDNTGDSSYNSATQIEIDPQDSNVMYVTSESSSSLQKLTISSDKNTLTESIIIGGADDSDQTPSGAADENESSLINMLKTRALFVGEDRVWTAGEKITLQEYNISEDRIKWVDEMGSSRFSRIDGAIRAIRAVVQDSSLLQGARFGFGEWNAGEIEVKRTGNSSSLWKINGDYACNCEKKKPGMKPWQKCNPNCNYYQFGGWKGDHPLGRTAQCTNNSCIRVGIDKDNSQLIINRLNSLKPRGIRFGTDARAFAQLAYGYYTDPKVVDREDKPLAPASESERLECQQNYVIIIGDGEWRNHDYAKQKINNLRKERDVKTLVIAYGKGISEKGKKKFQEIAIAGTCDNEDSSDCRDRIDAETPGDLLTKLKSEVERIVASRLSFTAPSITAELSGEEGGSLFQAQFKYALHGEWEGTLLRKHIREDGTIVDNIADTRVYNVAKIIQEQAVNEKRKIWTAYEGLDYISSYNNFTEDNASTINGLFGLFGDVVPNFHNSSSMCKDDLEGTPGLDTNADDIKGLINFARGKDYFAYGGCDNTKKVRTSVLGDIYHSQIVEVGRPKANTNFTSTHQEAYWRYINNYDNWARGVTRDDIMYFGANDGALHAVRTGSGRLRYGGDIGQEIWAFIPPFMAAKLPTVVNEGLNNVLGQNRGGTNAIFTVDGSPVVHDVYIQGFKIVANEDGEGGTSIVRESSKNWHTILFIPYGRGGPGFSVLDITKPDNPIHMYSIYNDRANSRVLHANVNGAISSYDYTSKNLRIDESEEAINARKIEQDARAADIALDANGDNYTNRDTKSTCMSNSDVGTNLKFHNATYDQGSACYAGSTFTFVTDALDNIDPIVASDFTVIYEKDGTTTEVPVAGINKQGSEVEFTFSSEMVYNASTGLTSDKEDVPFTIMLPAALDMDETQYDYSKLGETWSTPRIIRMPTSKDSSLDDDNYVAVLPGGFGTTDGIGSAVFLVDLEDPANNGGAIFGSDQNLGPIKIVDVPGNGITNSITGNPVVVTPDTFRGVPWRGAMVYVNDLEGKITKINLTNQQKDITEIDIFDQRTIFDLKANNINQRVSYFGMEAAYGQSTRNLWLFGGTGDFRDVGSRIAGMDNLLYGIRDVDFPNFYHGEIAVPAADSADENGNSNFKTVALQAVANAPNVDDKNPDAADCGYTRVRNRAEKCPGAGRVGWIFKLDDPELNKNPNGDNNNRFRKATAIPTIFGGTVYYPVYEPPPKGDITCSVGKAFICAADDECGINQAEKIQFAEKNVRSESEFDESAGCFYLQRGILSQFVISGNKLFANVTTESDDQADTLVTLLGSDKDIQVYRGSWQENF